MSKKQYVAYIGIDWADRKHDIHLDDPATGQTENYCIGAQPQDIQNWVTLLLKKRLMK
jgi:hypothetical protein